MAGSVAVVETHRDIAFVRMHRPPANAIDLELVTELADTFERLRACQPRVSALVFSGLSDYFSAGVDLERILSYDRAEQAAMVRGINRMVRALYGFPRPTVAAVTGHAIGGGMVLALCCDLRIGARGNYKLGLGEIAAGVPFPAAALVVTRTELSTNDARALMLGSQSLDPEQAHRRGLLDRLEDAGEVRAVALRECERLARLPVDVYARTKQAMRADALAQIERIVNDDDDPALLEWLSASTAAAARLALEKAS